jgi:hypothetical protein
MMLCGTLAPAHSKLRRYPRCAGDAAVFFHSQTPKNPAYPGQEGKRAFHGLHRPRPFTTLLFREWFPLKTGIPVKVEFLFNSLIT